MRPERSYRSDRLPRRHLRQRRRILDQQRMPTFLYDDAAQLARWAGIFVIVSAVGLGIWQAVDFSGPPGSAGFQFKVLMFWRSLVSVGSFGVIILLLTELLRRLPRDRS